MRGPRSQVERRWAMAAELFPGACLLAAVVFISSFAGAKKFAMSSGSALAGARRAQPGRAGSKSGFDSVQDARIASESAHTKQIQVSPKETPNFRVRIFASHFQKRLRTTQRMARKKRQSIKVLSVTRGAAPGCRRRRGGRRRGRAWRRRRRARSRRSRRRRRGGSRRGRVGPTAEQPTPW